MLLSLFACSLPGVPPSAKPVAADEAPATHEAAEAAEQSPGDVMDRLSRHSASLYFAGQTGETALAAWEVKEIREQLDELKGMTANGIDLGAAATEVMTGPLANLEAVTQPVEFETAYATLVVACNECHARTGVAFIEITTPRNPPWSNVKYGNMGRGGMGGMGGGGMGGPGGAGGMGGGGMGARPGAEGATGAPAGEGAREGKAGRPARPGRGMGPRGGQRPVQE